MTKRILRQRRKSLLHSSHLNADAERMRAQVREQFYAFRQYIRPDLLWGWWIQVVALHLQQFFEDLVSGKRPKLGLQAPPQHGKTLTVEDFIAWIAGRNPDL